MSQSALTVQEQFLPVATGENSHMADLMAEDMAGLTPSFERVTIPAGGAPAFTLPDGFDPPVATTLRGVIVDHHSARAFWPSLEVTGGAPPTCSSLDGQTGVGDRGPLPTGEIDQPGRHDCGTCPWAQFGTAVRPNGTAGRGQRCKLARRVYLLLPNRMFPILLSLPPTSIKDFTAYVQRVNGQGLALRQVVTEIGLRRQTGNGVPDFSVATFKQVGLLNEATAAAINAYAARIKAVTRQQIFGTAQQEGFVTDS